MRSNHSYVVRFWLSINYLQRKSGSLGATAAGWRYWNHRGYCFFSSDTWYNFVGVIFITTDRESLELEHLPYERSNRWKNGLLNWILYLTDADALMKALAQVMTLTEFEFRICCVIKKGCNWGILSQWKRFYIWALNLSQEIWSIEDKVGLLILNASINTQIWRYILYYFAQYPSSGWRYRCFSCCQLVLKVQLKC